MLRTHASDATGLGIKAQDVCRRLLDREGLENITVYQGLKNSPYLRLSRSTIFLTPRSYDQDTISAISEASTICGRAYWLTHPTWAHKISNKTLSYVLITALSLSIFLFLERNSLANEIQVFIGILLLSLFLRQLWLESSYGFEQLKLILSNTEFNRKLYKGFIFKPYRQGIAWTISLLWSAIVLMP
jgi:Putative neutral zinc metallopeptidase